MATRKLSAAQREEIRRIIKKDLANGIPEAEILNGMMAKYSVSYSTARWYLRKVTSGKDSQRRKASGRPAKKRYPRKAQNNDHGRSAVLRIARKHSKEDLRKAMAVSSVLPKLEAAQTKLTSLMKEEAKLKNAIDKAKKKTVQYETLLSKVLAD